MASMFSRPKGPKTPSQLAPISVDLPMAPGPRATPLPGVPAGTLMPTPGMSSNQPKGGGLMEILKQLGAV